MTVEVKKASQISGALRTERNCPVHLLSQMVPKTGGSFGFFRLRGRLPQSLHDNRDLRGRI